jgi:hypothetical protein
MSTQDITIKRLKADCEYTQREFLKLYAENNKLKDRLKIYESTEENILSSVLLRDGINKFLFSGSLIELSKVSKINMSRIFRLRRNITKIKLAEIETIVRLSSYIGE